MYDTARLKYCTSAQCKFTNFDEYNGYRRNSSYPNVTFETFSGCPKALQRHVYLVYKEKDHLPSSSTWAHLLRDNWILIVQINVDLQASVCVQGLLSHFSDTTSPLFSGRIYRTNISMHYSRIDANLLQIFSTL